MKVAIGRTLPVVPPPVTITLELSVSELAYIAAAVGGATFEKVKGLVENNALPSVKGVDGVELWRELRASSLKTK